MKTTRFKLLAIDDGEETLDELQAAVAHAFPAAAFSSARSGQRGIAEALNNPPDIILLDIVMPEMDGFETCRRFKEDIRLRDIPIVFLTAVKPDSEICEKAIEAGAEAFIAKPFELWELLVQIRAMLKIKAANLTQEAERARLQQMVTQRTHELAEQLIFREKALESLKESEALFKAIFTESPMGICLLDARAGRFLRVNAMLARITGRTPEELAGTDWRSITHPDDIAVQADSLARLESGSEKVLRLEKRYLKPDGSAVWVKLTATPLPAFDKSASRYLGMVEDISAAKTAEREKTQLEEQLRQSQKMEAAGSLAGGIAHDFNNMLSAILTYSDFLLKSINKEDPRRKDAEEIKTTGLRAAALTRQLLAFSRKQVLQPQILDINATITGMKAMLHRLIGENIKLTTVTSKEPALIKADPGYLEQVLLNLCVNARDAMPKGGKLSLEASVVSIDAEYVHRHGTLQPGKYALLAVSDNGCGMPPETKEHIFEPFFTTKPRDKGTGLGLSTVHGIVKQSGGTIVVASEEGGGTVFKLYFPLSSGEAAAAKQQAGRKFTAVSGTVLVVDDDDQIKALARRTLAEDGLSVIVAASAEEALSLCKRHNKRIDLLLTDMILPKMTGIELAEHLKSAYPEIKIIYMSGYTDHSVLTDGMLAPDKSFIQKPFTLDLLTQKVREALSSPTPRAGAHNKRV
jgi:PAS domain S-box-containing protein